MNTMIVNITDRKMDLRQPFRTCAWFRSLWFRMSLAGVVSMATVTGFATGAPASYLAGQIVMGLCVFLAFYLLADRPLFNPVQAVVAIFYWWLGVGPAVIATWNLLIGQPKAAWEAEAAGMEAFWIAAPGVLLYALIARWTLHWFAKTGMHARFLLPAGGNYRPVVLVIYYLLAVLATGAVQLLQAVGIIGLQEIDFLGGTKTNIWWVGAIAAVGGLTPFVTSALMSAAIAPWKKIPASIRILIIVTVVQTVIFALLGGWKGPLAALGAYYVCAYISRWQRPPWLVLAVGAVMFVTVITPYVNYGRNAALTTGAGNSAERENIFAHVLKNPQAFLPTGMEEIDPAIFFRGISPLAGEVTRRNEPFNGEWHGSTIIWGFESLVPRVIWPDKPDNNIGAFYTTDLGVDSVTARDNNDVSYISNSAISIPFEFVGNYGWCAGILAFGLLGVTWSLWCGWLLSPARLSNHPLTPWLVLSAMVMEQSLGNYFGMFRMLIIPLLLCFVIYRILGGKI
jgi:hypothetical protein